jgi:hypothetical protein
MRGRRVLSAILVVLPAIVGVATYPTTLKAASDASDCKAKPNSTAPVGSRWQYHINRVDHRHCWFLTSRSLVAHTRMSPASHRSHSVDAPDATAGSNAPQGGQVTPEVAPAQPAKIESAAASEQSTASEHQPLLVDLPTSDDLIPKMVTTITYSAHSAPEASPPVGPFPEGKRVGAQNLPRGGGTDLMFLGGALATAVLVAGLVFQIIGRLRQVRLTHPHHDAGAAIAQSVEEAVPVSSPTRSKSFGHAIARSNPTDDLKSKVDQWIFDLQKSRAHVSSVSFASRAPTTEPALVEDRSLVVAFPSASRPSTREALTPAC